ncbi:MAG: hypothetical protein BRD50_00590 [Bacteroidetes bacterium SW_11_45_7]|nr:MAG: hypothetical protein BRD50_00590 [Bacteroidetes bacterium SW_11_45_7]
MTYHTRLCRMFLLLCLVSPIFSIAQNNVQDARDNYNTGQQVTVSGIVTNDSSIGPVRYIQDSSAGIAVYGPSTVAPVADRGDSIRVTGTLKDYNGLLEIDPVSSFSVLDSNFQLPSANVITPSQVGENTEGELVKLNNVLFSAGGDTFSNSEYTFTANGEQGEIFIRQGHPLIGNFIPLSEVNLRGISSQFTFNQPATDGYQVLPRDSSDIVAQAPFLFREPVRQQNITTTSFELTWETELKASSNVEYGLTPSLELGHQGMNNSTNNHTYQLTGLSPATFYYVRVYSVNNGDTLRSSVGLYTTASQSSGSVRAYFNHQVNRNYSTTTDAEYVGNTFNDTIAAYIDSAENSVDLAIYNTNDATIVDAVNAAEARGVQVRYIANGSSANIGLSNLNNGVPLLERPSGSGIMHNKFVLIDPESTNNSYVLTGSTNFTQQNLFDDPNNMVILQDRAIAKAYQMEFEEMWGSNGNSPNQNQAKFGSDKLANTPTRFRVGDDLVELYFSPADRVTKQIDEAISSVDQELQFAVLSFTRDDLGQSIINKNNAFGIDVKGMIENTNDQGSEYQRLDTNNVDVQSHLSKPNIMHHKYAIIDQGSPNEDPLLVTGSHNWSNAAEFNNDENTLIIHDDTLTNHYYQEFMARFTGETDTATGIVKNNTKEEVRVYPNPASRQFRIDLGEALSQERRLKLYSMEGRLIRQISIGEQNRHRTIDVQHLEAGMYFLSLEKGPTSFHKKIVVE